MSHEDLAEILNIALYNQMLEDDSTPAPARVGNGNKDIRVKTGGDEVPIPMLPRGAKRKYSLGPEDDWESLEHDHPTGEQDPDFKPSQHARSLPERRPSKRIADQSALSGE